MCLSDITLLLFTLTVDKFLEYSCNFKSATCFLHNAQIVEAVGKNISCSLRLENVTLPLVHTICNTLLLNFVEMVKIFISFGGKSRYKSSF